MKNRDATHTHTHKRNPIRVISEEESKSNRKMPQCQCFLLDWGILSKETVQTSWLESLKDRPQGTILWSTFFHVKSDHLESKFRWVTAARVAGSQAKPCMKEKQGKILIPDPGIPMVCSGCENPSSCTLNVMDPFLFVYYSTTERSS